MDKENGQLLGHDLGTESEIGWMSAPTVAGMRGLSFCVEPMITGMDHNEVASQSRSGICVW